MAKLSLKDADLQQLDDDIDELVEEDESNDSNQQAALKSRLAVLEKVVRMEPRIASITANLMAHFEERNKAQTGKAMVVAMSRAFTLCYTLSEAKAVRGEMAFLQDEKLGLTEGEVQFYYALIEKEHAVREPSDEMLK